VYVLETARTPNVEKFLTLIPRYFAASARLTIRFPLIRESRSDVEFLASTVVASLYGDGVMGNETTWRCVERLIPEVQESIVVEILQERTAFAMTECTQSWFSFAGEDPRGRWRLRISDNAPGNANSGGELNQWRMYLSGPTYPTYFVYDSQARLHRPSQKPLGPRARLRLPLAPFH